MQLVRCTNIEGTINNQIKIGGKYWIDNNTRHEADGYEYVKVYEDETKQNYIGNLKTNLFDTVYRPLRYGMSLECFVNSHTGILLKDIIFWCVNNTRSLLAEKLILFIYNHKLNTRENMEKEFVVNSVPFKEFKRRGEEDKYEMYLGYSIGCIDCEP